MAASTSGPADVDRRGEAGCFETGDCCPDVCERCPDLAGCGPGGELTLGPPQGPLPDPGNVLAGAARVDLRLAGVARTFLRLWSFDDGAQTLGLATDAEGHIHTTLPQAASAHGADGSIQWSRSCEPWGECHGVWQLIASMPGPARSGRDALTPGVPLWRNPGPDTLKR